MEYFYITILDHTSEQIIISSIPYHLRRKNEEEILNYFLKQDNLDNNEVDYLLTINPISIDIKAHANIFGSGNSFRNIED